MVRSALFENDAPRDFRINKAIERAIRDDILKNSTPIPKRWGRKAV